MQVSDKLIDDLQDKAKKYGIRVTDEEAQQMFQQIVRGQASENPGDLLMNAAKEIWAAKVASVPTDPA